jgi:hypothetical protein
MLASSVLMLGCAEPLVIADEEPAFDVQVGESRNIELRFLRLDVEDFEHTLTIEDLREIPQSTLDSVWLLDMDLEPIVNNTLTQLADMSEQEAVELPQAARNMRKLLRTTPDNMNLDGTSLEELLALSDTVGIPAAKALGDIMEVGVTERVTEPEIAAASVIDDLIESHPAAQTRMGPVDAAHPDGVWMVADNSLPVTLGDVVSNFENLSTRFGPVETEMGTHPGFIEEAIGFSVIEDEFEMTVKVSINALPFKGADLTDASVASVNSTASQIEDLFDTSDPDWIRMEGVVEEPVITSLTVNILENDEFIAPGTQRDPLPQGSSPVWELPPWEFEYMVSDMSMRSHLDVSEHCTTYDLGTGTTAFEACVDDTIWVSFETFNDVGNPPEPSYLWDVQMEIIQIRIHDGGLAEGDADVQFTLDEVPVGLTADEIFTEVSANMADNPEVLQELAEAVTATTVGEADFYYYRPEPGTAKTGDWLFFIAPDDIAAGSDGLPVKDYTYAHPGFFADQGLSEKVSTTESVDGDDEHEKVEVQAGDVLYLEDDGGRVYRIDVREKPSLFRVSLDVTRVE